MLRATPPGEDGIEKPFSPKSLEDDGVGRAERGFAEQGEEDGYEGDDGLDFDDKPSDQEFLQMVREADAQALHYANQVNRTSWEKGYRAYHQEHSDGSKYRSTDYNNRSKLFIPKTRTAVRKDMAATAASLFGSIDAVNCMPGNEGDPMQRASAAVMKELLNYRTDRATGKASIPWFHVAMGARQTALITGICMSKQYWKLELKRQGEETFTDEEDGEEKQRDVWVPHIDRPECELFPPENFVIDPAADWTSPAQDAAYVILKFPMRIDEIRRRQRDPRNPWLDLDENLMTSAGEGAQMEAEAVRRSREQGLDRFDRTQTTRHFDVIWVWETFIRTAGEDWCFISIGGKHLLTEPRPVGEVYPEQFGERPLTLGYGSFEAFRIFPMSAVESWQMLQQESNDIRNLSLDALKQNIIPVTKVVRGKNVDLDQLRRRGQGSAIMVQNKDDVTWEKAPDLSAGIEKLSQKLDIEFDDLAGNQNYGTVEDNNSIGKTLGGLKLAAGAANAVQEFDIRIWIETWCEPVLSQIARLEQFYESDPIVLGICGDRAKLLQKHGINTISDELLENNVTVRVNIGLGSGDPQQRLAKFNSAVQVAMPLLQLDPDFQSGKKQMDSEAVMEEVFGAAGYRDGGKRFIKEGQAKANPMQQPEIDEKIASAGLKRAQAKKAILDALSNAAKVGIQLQDLELDKARHLFDLHHDHVEQVGRAQDMGHAHGLAVAGAKNAAAGLNPDGTPMLPPDGVSPAEGGSEGGGAPADAGFAAGGGDAASPPDQSAAMPGEEPGMAAPEAAPAAPAKSRRRKVTIASRGPDGRANAYNIEEDGEDGDVGPARAQPQAPAAEPAARKGTDHSKTIMQLKALAAELNKKKTVKRDGSGKMTIETDK